MDNPDVFPGQIHSSVEGGIGWIVLDNPSKLNAISIQMWSDVVAALAGFESDPAVRCVVFTGQGDKAFCVGADVAEKDRNAAKKTDVPAEKQDSIAFNALDTIKNFPKPTLAMVKGFCLGAGMAIAIACDMRIAEAGACFGIPAARLGLPYYFGGMQRLIDIVGLTNAKRIVFTADRFNTDHALRFGLIDEVASADQLLAAVQEIAGKIAANAPLTIAAAKFAAGQAMLESTDRDVAGLVAWERTCLESQDFVEGRRAFLEKRPPVFRGV